MKHLFIPYELAVIAKEKGFNEKCIATYTQNTIGKGDRLQFFVEPINPNDDFTFISAPLYQQIVDWLREKHKIYIYINPFNEILNFKEVVLFKWAIKDKCVAKEYSTYYEALNKAIEEAFKLIP